MAEYIELDLLRDEILNDPEYDGDTINYFLGIVDSQPTADVVEVVRCEKCRYFFDECCNHPKNTVAHRVPDFGEHYAYSGGIEVTPNHFCSYGEVRRCSHCGAKMDKKEGAEK